MEDLRAFGEARLAALKAGLVLTPEQEKNWPAFEQAARDYGKLRMDRMQRDARCPAEHRPGRAPASARHSHDGHGVALQKLADATDPLYKSLDDGQKRRFVVLSRLAGSRMEHFRGRDGHGPRHHHWGPRRTDGGPTSTWSTLANSACSHHISCLAPAVALPAPRHDRRRTGAAGSPPGGFPFVGRGSRAVGYRRSSTRRPWRSLDSPISLCYRTPPQRGSPQRQSGRIAQLVEQLTLNQRVLGSKS